MLREDYYIFKEGVNRRTGKEVKISLSSIKSYEIAFIGELHGGIFSSLLICSEPIDKY